jgi:hypothetical protein
LAPSSAGFWATVASDFAWASTIGGRSRAAATAASVAAVNATAARTGAEMEKKLLDILA